MPSVGHEILNEIERVTAKRERWRSYAKDAGCAASFGPGIYLMTIAIENAKAAIVNDDVLAVITAYEDLKGYDDND